MKYDCIIIGAGLSGLTAASLLAKRGLSVAVCENSSKPGGCCGVFKRSINKKAVVFDQGSSMLFGFGKEGFNAHRFLFNCLEEPFYVVKHDKLYAMEYDGHRIEFSEDLDVFTDALSEIFPKEKNNIKKFYNEMHAMYDKVISDRPSYTTPDEMDLIGSFLSFIKHPIAYTKFLSYMNMSAEQLLMKYFDDREILKFFDKLTSTYCYASVSEAPAILAAVMFIDNHTGGSWYPAGSTLFLPGVLEKIVEENNGLIYYDTHVEKILFEDIKPSNRITGFANAKASGVFLSDGTTLISDNVIFSGTVWDLYGKMLPDELVTQEMINWISAQEPTHPCLVFYGLVEKAAIPQDCCAVEMLTSEPGKLDENEITVYIPSIDDHTLCDENYHVIIAIAPSFKNWGGNNGFDEEYYQEQKAEESQRIINHLIKHFDGFSDSLIYYELATPFTIQRYTLKNGGAAAGPKQMLGQHMMKRQSIRTAWQGLYCCGESTTMGTGTPTVTVSGIAAANAVLKRLGKKKYKWSRKIKDQVVELEKPVDRAWINDFFPSKMSDIMKDAGKCMYCTKPICCKKEMLDVPGIMRRASCGNFKGAYDAIENSYIKISEDVLEKCPYGADPSKVIYMISQLKQV